jgi:predicted ATP-grasp superfamily ATP-dependent carboligase
MDCVIEKRLNKEIFRDNKEYFLTTMTDRFEYANILWANTLRKKYRKEFKPIFIQNCKQNRFFTKENYIIVNKIIDLERKKLGKHDIIYLEEYEDLNKEISESKTIKLLVDRLLKKQGRLFILDFTSSFLNFRNSKIVILGPDPKIVTKLDNKIEHIKIFKKLNVPRNKVKIYKSLDKIEKAPLPFYISAAYTSGGYESGPINNKKDMNKFKERLRKINKANPFIVARLIKDISTSPNTNAIVYGAGKTEVICVTDQILRGNRYLGNIYPSKASPKNKNKMIKVTKKIGNYLSRLGFRGVFGLDFIIDSKGNLYTVDLNPRRQGGYMCNLLMSKKIDITELELKVVLREKVGNFTYEDFLASFSWAHSKVKPHSENKVLLKAFKYGDFKRPFNKIGETFRCVFYPAGYLVVSGNCGYIILSGKSLKEVESRVFSEIQKANFACFGEKE